MNKKDLKELLESEHVFENKKEKKRIKIYNESIDYEDLKNKIYIPTSRCFGLFKYKADPILNEENQIISCIPEVNIYNRDSVDFIFLMTKGMINLLKDNINNLNELKDMFKNKCKENDNNIDQILNEYIDKKLEEKGNLNESNKNKNLNKNKSKNNYNTVYAGKEDFEEENESINNLKKNKYKDIIDLDKDKYYSCHDKYNITCILIKLLDKKYPDIEIQETKTMEKNENNNPINDESTKTEDNIHQIDKEKERKDEINKEYNIEKKRNEIEDNKINIDEENKEKEEFEKNNKAN